MALNKRTKHEGRVCGHLLQAHSWDGVWGQTMPPTLFGPAVGSRALRFWTAASLASVFVVIGAVLMGSRGFATYGAIGTQTLLSAFTVMLAAGITVAVMTLLGLPISSTLGNGWGDHRRSLLNAKRREPATALEDLSVLGSDPDWRPGRRLHPLQDYHTLSAYTGWALRCSRSLHPLGNRACYLLRGILPGSEQCGQCDWGLRPIRVTIACVWRSLWFTGDCSWYHDI